MAVNMLKTRTKTLTCQNVIGYKSFSLPKCCNSEVGRCLQTLNHAISSAVHRSWILVGAKFCVQIDLFAMFHKYAIFRMSKSGDHAICCKHPEHS